MVWFGLLVFGYGDTPPDLSPTWAEGLKFRSIGPFRGGRSAAVCGVPGQPLTFYFGSTGGGVWKTEDGGSNWKNVSDGYFGGSIGSVAVAASDPNVIYAGGGEVTVRGNVSHGDGLWRSDDAGRTWRKLGFSDAHHIPRIRIHPDQPDWVYVAVLGHLYGPNPERGVFRSKDGGKTWQKVLFVNAEVGACDLYMHPANPRWLLASTWRVKRTPYSLESGGPGSSLWFSPDGGDTWKNWDQQKGLPEGPWGIIGVTAAPTKPDRIWALIEAKEGGLFRSDDLGETWKKVNESRDLRQRAWYYTRVYADPKDADTVYVVNVQFWKSKDGGTSFKSLETPHGDHHDLWLDPDQPKRMIIADDGGAQISFDGGENWSTYHNQPTAQFYRVTTDSAFPYRIYGAQQDNSTVRIRHRSINDVIDEEDWEATAGGESGHIAIDPTNSDIVYGGSYGGYLTRLDHRTGAERLIDVWPRNPMGHAAGDLRYRFQWNFPIFFSPHNPKALYVAANQLFRTTDEGQTWETVSPDLTRNDPLTLGSSGGPITQDNTSVEYYGTIFAAMESPTEPGVLWTGSDDGLVHVSRDNGANWSQVTPKDLPKSAMINSLEADPHHAGGLYLAATCYKSGDFKPYLFSTKDYGKTWKKIVNGIDPNHFTRVVRADPERVGLLYCGTENGFYLSWDDGSSWSRFQLNLPITPITDLAVKDKDLIVATQGRSFWVLDDLSPLHQYQAALMEKPLHVFTPRPAYRLAGSVAEKPQNAGKNAPNGPVLTYTLKAELEKDKKDQKPLSLEILDANRRVLAQYSSKEEKGKKRPTLPAKKGLNRFVWDMRLQVEPLPEGMILWTYSGRRGPMLPPGNYTARFKLADTEAEVPLVLQKDPRSTSTDEQLIAQFDFVDGVLSLLEKTNLTVESCKKIRSDLERLEKRLDGEGSLDLKQQAKDLMKRLKAIEESLYQTQNKSRQDPLNFPIQLNDQLAGLAGQAGLGDFPPTEPVRSVYAELEGEINAQLEAFAALKNDIQAFNQAYTAAGLPVLWIEDPAKTAENKPENP
ncbi:MAG: glycosyl hydrolase [Acidobacteria bacterium]|nr:glycosyl hydrolase [Acidobacteriota bacterium]